jgi:hypothetical protein
LFLFGGERGLATLISFTYYLLNPDISKGDFAAFAVILEGDDALSP